MQIIPLSSITIRRRQRSSINPASLAELKESILGRGLLHPPVCWYDQANQTWVLTVGERRFRAIEALAKEGREFHCGHELVKPGQIAISPLGDYLDEVGRFEAELDENLRREDISWQDRTQALADLHRMRLAANPKQTFLQTAAELVERAPTISSANYAQTQISDAMVIAEHLDDPTIAQARNANEAMALILKKEEEKVRAELVRRQLLAVGEKPKLELRHGDLLSVLPLLDAGTFDLILTDPPYGIDAGSAGFRARTVHHHNYEDSPEVARSIAECILSEGFRVSKPRANIFMFGAIEYFEWWKRVAANTGWVPFNRPLIWQKSQSEGLAPWGAQGPRITTEFIFYATKGQKGLVASPIDVFEVKRVPRSERLHAAEKPVELLRLLIDCATLPGESVLDPCCGSGSTLVACREGKRVGLGIEKDQTYFNTAMTNVHSSGGPDA